MDPHWLYQIRIGLDPDHAKIARSDPDHPSLGPLREILAAHHAVMQSQYDAFAAYVAAAEREGVEHFPLYKWTRATLEDPAKREKHSGSFALQVDGEAVYAAAVADALAAALQPLVGTLITRLSRHDTNPANNLPVPAAYR